MNEHYYLGVDLGGTQIRMAGVNRNGQLVTPMFSHPTGKEFSSDDLAARLADLYAQVRSVISAQPIEGLGMGITGLVSATTVSQSDFLPRLNEVNLIELIHQATGCSAKLENDARCFVLAESQFGAAKGLQNVVGLTIGTGLGGGVIVNGQLIRGVHANAGEVWSIPLHESFIEHFVSGSGIVRAYQKTTGNEDEMTAEAIAELARQGNKAASQTYERLADDLWILCETIRALLDPDVVVIGGSIAQSRDVFGARLQQKLAERGPRIAWAELGTTSGVIGAASLLMR